MLGALTVPDIETPSTALVPYESSVPMEADSQGNDLQPMSPMDSIRAIFEDIRDGINDLVELSYNGFSDLIQAVSPDMRDQGIAAADVAPEVEETDSQGNDKFGFLKNFKIPPVGPKLGLALLLGGLAALIKFGDKLVPIIAPVLKAIKENILPNLIDTFKGFLDAASNLFSGIKEKVITIFGGTNPDGSDATILDRLTALGGIFTDFANFILNIGNTLVTNVLEMFGVNFEPYDSAGAYVLGKLNEMWQGVTGFFMDAKDFVVEGVTGVSDYVVQKTMAAFEGVTTWFSETGTFLLEGATGIIDWIKGKLALPFEFLTDLFSFSEEDATAGGLATKLIDILLLGPNLAINFLKGLFGFGGEDDIEDDELRTFSFGELIIGAVKSAIDYVKDLFTFDTSAIKEKFTSMANIFKGLAAGGAAAASAMLPGGESPGEAFNRVFSEYTQGNESDIGSTIDVKTPGETFGTPNIENMSDEELKAQQEKLEKQFAASLSLEGQVPLSDEMLKIQIENQNKIASVLDDIQREMNEREDNQAAAFNNIVTTTDNSTTVSSNQMNVGDYNINGTDATAKALSAMGHGN